MTGKMWEDPTSNDWKTSCTFQKGAHPDQQITPLKFNMEPEEKSPEKVIPFGKHHFQVPC